jgi:hypothetical protein
MYPYKGSPLRLLLALAMIGAAGCGDAEPEIEQPSWKIDPATLKPVSGIITLKGKPLSKAVVAFFSKSGVPSVAETDGDGRYVIQTMNMDGAPPGEYKVTVSYFLSTSGEPQGLAARSAMVHSAAMISARETLPPVYTDVNHTRLAATIGNQGGQFDFDIDATPEAPKKQEPEQSKKSEAEKEPAAPAATP